MFQNRFYSILIVCLFLFLGGALRAENHDNSKNGVADKRGFGRIEVVDGKGRPRFCIIQYQGRCFATLDDLQEHLIGELRKSNPAIEKNSREVRIVTFHNQEEVCTTGRLFEGVCYSSQEDLIQHLIRRVARSEPEPASVTGLLPRRFGEAAGFRISFPDRIAKGGYWQKGKQVEGMAEPKGPYVRFSAADPGPEIKGIVRSQVVPFRSGRAYFISLSGFEPARFPEQFIYHVNDESGRVGTLIVRVAPGERPSVAHLRDAMGDGVAIEVD